MWKPPMRPQPTTPMRSCSDTALLQGAVEVGDGQLGDPPGGVAVAEDRRALARRRLREGGAELLGVDADQRVPAGRDRLDPLGLLAHRDARHPPQISLALD